MEVTHEEVLFERVLAQSDGGEDWRELEALSVRDGAVWQRLAATLQNGALLRGAFERELTAGGRVDLPRGAVRVPRSAFGWLGWIAATLVLCLWLGDRLGSAAGQAAGPATGLAGGRELPSLLLEARPRADGGYDVVFVRRQLEERHVEQLYDFGFDETGAPAPVPASPARFLPGKEF
jgi:hypothetical protein